MLQENLGKDNYGIKEATVHLQAWNVHRFHQGLPRVPERMARSHGHQTDGNRRADKTCQIGSLLQDGNGIKFIGTSTEGTGEHLILKDGLAFFWMSAHNY